jgi:hypothetical protein
MGLKKAPPGERTAARPIYFGYVQTPKNSQWEAYVAGPAWWGMCHYAGKTKPCLHWVSDGALECPMCASVKPPEMVGYLPVWRAIDGRPVMVLVHEITREVVDSHGLHVRVLVGRGVDKTDGCYVIRAIKPGIAFSTTMAEKLRPADVTHSLLTMWRLPTLTAWYHAQHGIPDGGCTTPPARTPSVPVARPDVAPLPSMPADGPTDDALARLLRRARQAEGQGADYPPPE